MKKYLLLVCICLYVGFLQAQSVLKTMKNLPGTAQTASYTNTLGEDADYNYHAPFYIVNGNGTVLDTVTGLLWQQSDGGEMTVANAAIYCDTLTLGGFTDWRLPNCHELFSLFNHDKSNPALPTSIFTQTAAEYWWSSQAQANDASKVWVTNAGGGVGNHPKSETVSAGGTKKFHVRAVRDVTPPSTLAQHFINNGDSTTTDLLTNLTWLQVPYIDSLTWEDALITAENLNFAGYSDWRMPDIKELQSINDESIVNPSVSSTFFSGIGIKQIWSSTSLPNQPTKAWYLDTKYGITTYYLKTGKRYLLCVRGGNATTAIDKSEEIYSSLHVFPNPSQGLIYIKCDFSIKEIIVTDMLGRTIYEANPESEKCTIQFEKSGVYSISVWANGLRMIKRVRIDF